MTIEHIKSEAITNATATPRVPTDANIGGGLLREACGTVVPLAAAEAASTYRFCRVPSNARISQLLLKSLDFTTAGAIDIGLYASNGGAVIDADLFAAAIAMQSGPYENLDVTYESTQYSSAESEKMLWEVIGLTSDPGVFYDVVATVTTNFDGGQPIHLKVRWVE